MLCVATFCPATGHLTECCPWRPQFTVGSPVSVARVDSTESLLAVGGRENDLQVWDLETQKSVWKVRARDAVAQR